MRYFPAEAGKSGKVMEIDCSSMTCKSMDSHDPDCTALAGKYLIDPHNYAQAYKQHKQESHGWLTQPSNALCSTHQSL